MGKPYSDSPSTSPKTSRSTTSGPLWIRTLHHAGPFSMSPTTCHPLTLPHHTFQSPIGWPNFFFPTTCHSFLHPCHLLCHLSSTWCHVISLPCYIHATSYHIPTYPFQCLHYITSSAQCSSTLVWV